jgi:hypothetical protein
MAGRYFRTAGLVSALAASWGCNAILGISDLGGGAASGGNSVSGLSAEFEDYVGYVSANATGVFFAADVYTGTSTDELCSFNPSTTDGSVVSGTTGASQAGPITSDATNVYWFDGSSVRETARSGDGGLIPLASVSSIGGIAVDSTYVYWSDVTAMAIKRVPIATGEVASIVSSQTAPGFVAVDSTYVYWTTGNANLFKYPLAQLGLAGGTIMTVTPLDSLSPPLPSTRRISIDQTARGSKKYRLQEERPRTSTCSPRGLLMASVNGNSLYWISGNEGIATLMSLTPN